MTALNYLVKVDREHWAIKPAETERNRFGKRPQSRERATISPPAASTCIATASASCGLTVAAGQASTGDDDIFIPPNEINGAMQGDQVLVEVGPPKRDGRRMGRIARVLERKNPTVVGVFHYARKGRRGAYIPGEYRGNFVTPFDSRMTQPILIPEGAESPNQGRIEASRSRRRSRRRPRIRRSRRPGRRCRNHQLAHAHQAPLWPRHRSPRRAGRLRRRCRDDHPQASAAAHLSGERARRSARVAHLDAEEVAGAWMPPRFPPEPIVTIDGETARDFDDAVLVRELPDGGWELQVHIADVAEYVRPAPISISKPACAAPAFTFLTAPFPCCPHELSTDICSLRPNEDRLVLSCIMRLTAEAAWRATRSSKASSAPRRA
jgi:ribonuclease R